MGGCILLFPVWAVRGVGQVREECQIALQCNSYSLTLQDDRQGLQAQEQQAGEEAGGEELQGV